MKQWKIRVIEDIKKQFRDFAIVKSLHPGIEIPVKYKNRKYHLEGSQKGIEE